MSQSPNIDGVLIPWGDRLFYPGNRMVKTQPQPKLSGLAARQRAAVLRERIEAIVTRRVPQVMVKVTGGGRGMKAIAAHLRYTSKNGRLEIEDERGQKMQGKESLHELADDWRFGGSLIEDISHRREAFNIMLSMPRGTDALTVQWAAREFAKIELADHKFVMVLHDHQANPHVHISVRAESKHGKRLNPRKTDLHRWRETFAEKLRERGEDAEATRQATRGATRNHPDLWQVKAAADGRLLRPCGGHRRGVAAGTSRAEARQGWHHIATGLSASGDTADRKLAESIHRFTHEMGRDAEPVRSSAMQERATSAASPSHPGRGR
jgi:hypothetical protein